MEDNGSLTRVAAFPIGMDPESFTRALQRQDVATNIQQLLARYAGRKVDLHTRNSRSETLDPKPKGLLPKLQSLGSSCLVCTGGSYRGPGGRQHPAAVCAPCRPQDTCSRKLLPAASHSFSAVRGRAGDHFNSLAEAYRALPRTLRPVTCTCR